MAEVADTDVTPDSADAPAALEAIVETSRVSVVSAPGRVKNVYLPVDGGPVPMGLHGGVAEHYKAPADIEPHATTLDYLVGAVAACLSGTFGGMLRALGQDTDAESFTTTGTGTIVKDQGVLRVAAVEVFYVVHLGQDVKADLVRRAHDRHVRHCPVARTVGGCIEIRTVLTVV